MTWDNLDNNKQFLAQAVVMTVNETLSIPNALKQERPDDYYENTATIEWPLGPGGKAFPIKGNILPARGVQGRRPRRTAKEFVRFLVGEGWLRTISISPASGCCRRCRSCSTSHSGSIRAIRTAWPR